MRVVQVDESCSARCGVRVTGEVDTTTREFVHQFGLPAGAEEILKPRKTEVERVRLVTFSPGSRLWLVECPICGQNITIMRKSP
jgi:hypothetical protein